MDKQSQWKNKRTRSEIEIGENKTMIDNNEENKTVNDGKNESIQIGEQSTETHQTVSDELPVASQETSKSEASIEYCNDVSSDINKSEVKLTFKEILKLIFKIMIFFITFKTSRFIKNINEKCKSYVSLNCDDECAPRFMTLAGLMKDDTKYININSNAGIVNQLNDVTIFQLILGRFNGNKYIKVK